MEENIPQPGTVHSVNLLQSLANRYPDAKFAVYVESWVDEPSYWDISLNRDFMLMDDDNIVLCGKLPDRNQVFIIEAGVGNTEDGRARLLRLAEKLGV